MLDFDLADNLALKVYHKPPFCQGGILRHAAFDAHGEALIRDYDIRCAQGIRTPVRSMSGGNQQKAIIAREIEGRSQLMIFVQPTRGLDIGAIEYIHRQILAERERGSAVLLISLELEEIMALADTIGVIYNGQLQSVAPAHTMTTSQVGQFMMGVRGQ
ncbi:hypothetical protein SDC9_100932 [bioreactor metagenome]|uniref:Uncharacterized protein n=1 Tax=bioreactor metagenome TaxID=1076179 RepID=A0A645ALY1_9ZZZZ